MRSKQIYSNFNAPFGTIIDPSHPLSQGLVGLWLFNEGAGLKAFDISGNNSHGVLTNMDNTNWRVGKYGKDLFFDGGNEHIVGDDAGFPSGTNPKTCAMWVYHMSGGAADDWAFGYGTFSSTKYFAFGRRVDGAIFCSQHGSAVAASNIATGEWTHIAVTNVGNSYQLHKNGVPLGFGGMTTNTTLAGAYHIGQIASGANFTGLINNVRLYNRVLADEEIRQLYIDPYANLLRMPTRIWSPPGEAPPEPPPSALFPNIFQPRGQKISHKWRTHVQKTIKGGEKRTALFTWPRIGINKKLGSAVNQEINWLKREFTNNVDELWGIDIWADKTLLTAEAASAQKILTVGDTTNRHFYEGRKVLLQSQDTFDNYEIGVIDTIDSDTQITLEDNLAATWGINTYVVPLYDCRINQKQQMMADIINYQRSELEATEAFESQRSFAYSLPSSGADTYIGIDMFLQKPMRPLTYGFGRSYDLIQSLGLGHSASKYDSGENDLTIKGSYIRKTRQEIWDTLNFFDSKQGRFQRFWMPTWSKDIVATSAILDSDTVLDIEDIEYSTYYLSNDIIGRYIYIEFPDGTYTAKKIISPPSSTEIELEDAIGTAVAENELDDLKISFLYLLRFDIDEIEVDYLKENIAKIDLSFVNIPEELVLPLIVTGNPIGLLLALTYTV